MCISSPPVTACRIVNETCRFRQIIAKLELDTRLLFIPLGHLH
jgi:hypothetical protein